MVLESSKRNAQKYRGDQAPNVNMRGIDDVWSSLKGPRDELCHESLTMPTRVTQGRHGYSHGCKGITEATVSGILRATVNGDLNGMNRQDGTRGVDKRRIVWKETNEKIIIDQVREWRGETSAILDIV